MKSIIGFILLAVWFLYMAAIIGQEPGDWEPLEVPNWVGYVVLLAIFGLPFLAFKLIDPKK